MRNREPRVRTQHRNRTRELKDKLKDLFKIKSRAKRYRRTLDKFDDMPSYLFITRRNRCRKRRLYGAEGTKVPYAESSASLINPVVAKIVNSDGKVRFKNRKRNKKQQQEWSA